MPVTLLDRPRLRRRLSGAAQASVIVVSGMAGAGKSTAVRQWHSEPEVPEHAWLTLDARDGDAARFWGRFSSAAGVADWAPEGPGDIDSLDELVRLLDGATTRLLVLDDLHFVLDSDVLSELEYVVRRLPHGFRVVLISRSRSPIALGRLRAEGALAELGAEELAFTRDEISQLWALAGDDLDRVFVSTQGLPVAVALGRSLALEGALPAVSAGAELTDFLVEEFFEALPVEVREFALGVAVLDPVTVDAAAAVTGVGDARRILDLLASRGLVASGAADARGAPTFVMHSVIRDFLLEQLDAQSTDRASSLHSRASEFFAGADWERAIMHALAADDALRAAELIEQNLAPLQEVSYATQLRWLLALPDGMVQSRQALCAHASLVAAYERRFDVAERWLRGREATEPITAEGWGALTMQCVVVGDLPRQALAAAKLHELVDDSHTLWDLSNGALAGALHSTGDAEAALAVMVGMLRPVHARPVQFLPLQSTARAVVVRLLVHLGRLEEARTALEDLREWVAEASSVEGFDAHGCVEWAESMLALAEGDVAAAEAWTAPPPPESSHGPPFLEVWLHTDFAAVRAASGDEAAARGSLYRVQTLLSRFASPGLLEDRLRAVGEPLGVAPLVRRAAEATKLVESLSERESMVLALLDSDLSVREIADHLFLSHNTVKTHVRSVYRKLRVGSRLAAVRVLRRDAAPRADAR